LTTKT